jgi:hypothetical protein
VEFVTRVFLTPPAIATERVKNATRIVRDAIDSMGLRDLDISPSTPGNSPAEKNYLKDKRPIEAEVWSADQLKGLMATHPAGHGDTAITNREWGLGMGHGYRKDEWKPNPKTGQIVHSAPKGGVTFTKVKE